MSNLNQHSDRDAKGKLLRGGCRSCYGPHFPSGAPKWWRKLYMTRPRRRANALCCTRIAKSGDPGDIPFPLGNHKPHVYYW
jgi:hypothetical protein